MPRLRYTIDFHFVWAEVPGRGLCPAIIGVIYNVEIIPDDPGAPGEPPQQNGPFMPNGPDMPNGPYI